MRRSLLYSAALGLVALGLAGCGGGDDEETTTAPTTSETPTALGKEELLAQGDGICAEVNAAVGTVGTTDSGAASQALQVADLYAGMVARLQDLGAPSDDSAGYDEFIAAAQQLAQAESDVQLAAERGEEEALASAEADASSALASFQSAATSFGFTQCAEGPSAPVPGTTAGAGSAEEPVEGVEEEAPEAEEEVAPETGGAGSAEEAGGAGGGAPAGGGTEGGGEAGGGEGSGGGIGPG